MGHARKIIISGATGLIGTHLADYLKRNGWDLVSLSRDIEKSKRNLPAIDKHILWNPVSGNAELYAELTDAAAIINLAGASIGEKRWTDDYKKLIISSRVNSTQTIVNSIREMSNPPALINASAIGYYGDRQDEILTEASDSGGGFLAEVTRLWEAEALKAADITQVTLVRTGIVLAKNGGALEKLIKSFKLFTGGPLGSGRQYWSLVHIDDILRMFEFVIENKISGPVNFVSPNPVKMKDFAKVLGEVMQRPSIMKVPEVALRLLLGESADLVLHSERVLPEKLQSNNFSFNYSELRTALEEILL